MSITRITVERVNSVENHPNADRLDVIQVLGFKVVCGRDQFKVGDAAIYFPADMLLSEPAVTELGVEKYLKHSQYPHEAGKRQCRVSACRLRGVPSYGFVVGPVSHEGAYGVDLTARYGGYKYEPPVRVGCGDAQQETPIFHTYTSIENIQRYPNTIPIGTNVRITEKLHGTNCRLGKVNEDGWVYAAGSHKVRRQEPTGTRRCLYWDAMTPNVKKLIDALCENKHDIVVFGEIFGQGVQDMDYGQEGKSFRVFDITRDGVYMDYHEVRSWCHTMLVPTVPLLHEGPFTHEIVEKLTYGPSTFQGIKCKFKDREGCVITPLTEQQCRLGRMILKSVSADYRDRKGAKDIA